MSPELNQKRAALIKELNYLWNNPALTSAQREKVLEKLQEVLVLLRSQE